MRSCNRFLGDLGLFPAHNEFVRLAINGDDQGLYLLVERLRDAIRRWMAFNSLIQNADSAGEMFLFEVRSGDGPGRLGVMGCDYDDLMAKCARRKRRACPGDCGLRVRFGGSPSPPASVARVAVTHRIAIDDA